MHKCNVCGKRFNGPPSGTCFRCKMEEYSRISGNIKLKTPEEKEEELFFNFINAFGKEMPNKLKKELEMFWASRKI